MGAGARNGRKKSSGNKKAADRKVGEADKKSSDEKNLKKK